MSQLMLEGPLVMGTVVDWLPRLKPLLAQGDVTLDFTAATQVDSSALALVMEWQRQATAAGRRLSSRAVPHNLVVLARLYDVGFLVEAA
jgi:phospholipid transport system transporter-binding protein